MIKLYLLIKPYCIHYYKPYLFINLQKIIQILYVIEIHNILILYKNRNEAFDKIFN